VHVLRPIRENDLAGLAALARSTGGGLTTLPPDDAFLAARIDDSQHAFRPRVRQPKGEYYLFALEDSVTRELVGVSGIASRVGGYEPWYTYEIRPERHAHPPLNIVREIAVLHLRQEHQGPSELCSLFLRGDRRRGGAGRLLSLGRLLFISAHRNRFTPTLMAEMRGYIDQTGRSPFWEAVGRHFFAFDFYQADVLSGLGGKQFIADLMPRHPIYVPLLPPEVQAVIGRVRHETEPALSLLLAEGFTRTNEVDIFDAGPLVRVPAGDVRTVREARVARLRSAAATLPAAGPLLLIANGALDFRASIGAALGHDDGSVSLGRETAAALDLEPGDQVWIAPLRPDVSGSGSTAPGREGRR
jgi:arginine N-succinyltransferase